MEVPLETSRKLLRIKETSSGKQQIFEPFAGTKSILERRPIPECENENCENVIKGAESNSSSLLPRGLNLFMVFCVCYFANGEFDFHKFRG